MLCNQPDADANAVAILGGRTRCGCKSNRVRIPSFLQSSNQHCTVDYKIAYNISFLMKERIIILDYFNYTCVLTCIFVIIRVEKKLWISKKSSRFSRDLWIAFAVICEDDLTDDIKVWSGHLTRESINSQNPSSFTKHFQRNSCKCDGWRRSLLFCDEKNFSLRSEITSQKYVDSTDNAKLCISKFKKRQMKKRLKFLQKTIIVIKNLHRWIKTNSKIVKMLQLQ